MRQRVVKPELLDSLPHDHPEALRNRRELRLVNALMGNHRWLEREARRRLPSGCRALEVGAGRGELALRLRRRMELAVDGLDLCPAPDDWPAERRWWRAGLQRFDGFEAYDAVFANLIWHQFDDATLGAIGARLGQRVRFLFACEPARLSLHVAQFRALATLGGFGRVSRNDGRVSIYAGFRGEELPRILGLDTERWEWRCRSSALGRYSVVAWRRDGARP